MTINQGNSSLVLALVLGGFVAFGLLEWRDRRRRRDRDLDERAMRARRYRGFLR